VAERPVALPPESERSGDRPDIQLLLLANNLRARAVEILAKAEIMDEARARVTMREVASRYETLAQRVEHGADET